MIHFPVSSSDIVLIIFSNPFFKVAYSIFYQEFTSCQIIPFGEYGTLFTF
jgi:hypothetical protein